MLLQNKWPGERAGAGRQLEVSVRTVYRDIDP